MPSAVFEPAILTVKGLQTYVLAARPPGSAPQPYNARQITPVPTEQEAWWIRQPVWTFRRGKYDQNHAEAWRKFEDEAVIQNTVELAGEAWLEDVKEGDVEELLQSHDYSLTNDKLRELGTAKHPE